MNHRRTCRVNSLLKETLAKVIQKEVKNPHISEFVTVADIQVSRDLRYAKVFISILGSEEEREESMRALNHSAGFIQIMSAKKVSLRYFPKLSFFLDKTAEIHEHIENLLQNVNGKELSIK